MITKYTGLEYLKIDIINNYSSKLEKQNFEDRLNYFDNNKICPSDADNTALCFAGLSAYNDYKNNIPSGYLISLDACASGKI